MTRSIHSLMIIGIGWLLPFWSLPYLTAFVTLPTQQRSPSLFTGDNHAPCGLVGVHLFGDTAKDIAFKTKVETLKRDIEVIKAEAEPEIAEFKTDLENAEARSIYLMFVNGKLRNQMKSQCEKAVSDAQSIKRKAIWDMEAVAYNCITAFMEAQNSTDRSVSAETTFQEMERIKAKGLQQIADISAQLNKEAKVATETIEMLIAAIE